MHYHLLTLSPIESIIQVVLPSGEGNELGSQRLWVQIWYQVPGSYMKMCHLLAEHDVRHIVTCSNIIMWDTLWPAGISSCETHCDLLTEHHVRHIVTCSNIIMWDTLWPAGISCETLWPVNSIMWDTLWPVQIPSCETHCGLQEYHHVKHIVTCRQSIMWDALWPVGISCETHCDLSTEHHVRHCDVLEYHHMRHVVTCWQSVMWDVVTCWQSIMWDVVTCWQSIMWDVVTCWQSIMWDVTCWQSVMWDMLWPVGRASCEMWPVGRASCETCCDLLADPKQTLTAQWRSIHAQLQVEFTLPQPIFDQDQYCSKQSSTSLKGLFSHHLDWCLFCLSSFSLFKWQRLLLNCAACAEDFTCESKDFQTSCVTHEVQCSFAATKQDTERFRSFSHTMSILCYSVWNGTEGGLTC